MAEIERSAAFEKAADVARKSQVAMSTEKKLVGYGFYKVATTGKAPVEEERPSMFNFTARQKWFAHEAAWKDTGGDAKRAQEEYVKYTEEVNDLEPGSLSK